jgi:hypothetical protein
MLALRIATSGKFNETYLQIRNDWSLEDFFQALEMLEIIAATEKALIPSNTE